MRKRSKIRVADAKEVGVGNPAEETYRHPNQITALKARSRRVDVNTLLGSFEDGQGCSKVGPGGSAGG